MSDRQFRIQFTTTADTRGAEAVISANTAAASSVKNWTQAAGLHGAAIAQEEAQIRKLTQTALTNDGAMSRIAANRTRESRARQVLMDLEAEKERRIEYGRQLSRSARNTPGGGVSSARSAPAAAGRGGNAGLAALEASRAFEDAQYGIGGVLNNIPGLLGALNVPTAAIAAISVAAVGVAQLAKNLTGLDDAAGKMDNLEKLRATVVAMEEEFTSLGERLVQGFSRDLAEARKQWDKELTAAERAIAAGRKTAAQTEAQAGLDLDSNLAQGDLAKQRMIADGTPEQEAERARVENDRQLRQAAEKARLEREQIDAGNNAERAANSVVAGRRGVAQAQADLAAAPELRQEEIARLRGAGILSDQEQQVIEYDTALQRRSGANAEAAQAEQAVQSFGGMMANAAGNPIQLATLAAQRKLAQDRAEKARQTADQYNVSVDTLSPFAEQARAEMESGKVTYNRASERKDLLPGQRAALEQGKAGLTEVSVMEKDAAERLKQAQNQVTQAQTTLDEFIQAVRAAEQRLTTFETTSGAQNMEALRNAPLDAPLPALPGASAPITPLGPDLPSLDISQESGAITEALRDTQMKVTTAMANLADVAGQSSSATAAALGSVNAKIAAMQQDIQTIKNAPSE